MSLELDHAFIFVSEGAPEADILSKFGFKEGEPNVHPGQGTSNRRFFFNNMMLELLWVSDFNEVKRGLTKPTMLLERWSGRNKTASPFGIMLNSPDGKIPFESWQYRPDYLPGGLSFSVGTNSGIPNEPIIIGMPTRTKKNLQQKNYPLQNLPHFNNVSSLRINMPSFSPKSSVLRSIEENTDKISFEKSETHVMEIVFDEGIGCMSKDFRPELPLIVKW